MKKNPSHQAAGRLRLLEVSGFQPIWSDDCHLFLHVVDIVVTEIRDVSQHHPGSSTTAVLARSADRLSA